MRLEDMRDLLEKFGMTHAAPKSIRLAPSAVLEKAAAASEELPKGNRYAELVGGLMYLAIATRPDIMFAVGALARFMSAPTAAHWNLATGVLRYLVGTATQGLVYTRGQGDVIGWCDSDYAGDLSKRRSTTGFVFTYNGTAVSWASRLQATVAVSTVEAEYMAASFATKEALWLRKILSEMGVEVGTMCMQGDNQGAIACTENAISSIRTKHIDVQHHFVRQRVERGEVQFHYCPTSRMVADALTKAVPEDRFVRCRIGMGVR